MIYAPAAHRSPQAGGLSWKELNLTSFRDEILKNIIHKASDRLKSASNIGGITERTDALIAAREENDRSFDKASFGPNLKIWGLGMLQTLGTLAAVSGLTIGLGMVLPLAIGAGGLAVLPLMLATFTGYGAAAFGTIRGMEYIADRITSTAAADRRDIAEAKKESADAADQALTQLRQVYPAETAKSTRLAAFLKRTFNPAATDAPKAATALNAPAALALPAKTAI